MSGAHEIRPVVQYPVTERAHFPLRGLFIIGNIPAETPGEYGKEQGSFAGDHLLHAIDQASVKGVDALLSLKAAFPAGIQRKQCDIRRNVQDIRPLYTQAFEFLYQTVEVLFDLHPGSVRHLPHAVPVNPFSALSWRLYCHTSPYPLS